MSKEERFDYIFVPILWGQVSLEQLKEDIVRLESLGVNYLEIECDRDNDVVINTYKKRLETDGEYAERLKQQEERNERIKQVELETLKKLKEKYEHL